MIYSQYMRNISRIILSICLIIIAVSISVFLLKKLPLCKDLKEFNIKRVHELPGTLNPPVCIIWYKQLFDSGDWQIYKSFSSAEKISSLLILLNIEENKKMKEDGLTAFHKTQKQAKVFKGDQILSFVYYKPRFNIITFRNMEFSIYDEKLVWSGGESHKLFELFSEQEEWGDYGKCLDDIFKKSRNLVNEDPNSEKTDKPLGKDYPFPKSD